MIECMIPSLQFAEKTERTESMLSFLAINGLNGDMHPWIILPADQLNSCIFHWKIRVTRINYPRQQLRKCFKKSMENMYTDVTVQKVNDWLDDCNLQRKQKVLVQRFLFMRSLGLITTMTREKKPRSEVIIQWFELVLSETKKAGIDQLFCSDSFAKKNTFQSFTLFNYEWLETVFLRFGRPYSMRLRPNLTLCSHMCFEIVGVSRQSFSGFNSFYFWISRLNLQKESMLSFAASKEFLELRSIKLKYFPLSACNATVPSGW